jgi:ADP-heptose:LPS heptosyltransferase
MQNSTETSSSTGSTSGLINPPIKRPVRPKILMIRLSSLGDVILSTSALSAVRRRFQVRPEVHWVVSREFATLLKGHPQIDKIWVFDRKAGLRGWLALCARLWAEGYTEVNDLHSTLRSRVARVYFVVREYLHEISKKDPTKDSKTDSRENSKNSDDEVEFAAPVWRTLDKERLKLNAYFLFKGLWPEKWRPSPLVKRFSKLVGGSGDERPDLAHLVEPGKELLTQDFIDFGQNPYLCVMPSSKWDGKKWAVRNFFEVIRTSGLPAVILGSHQDRESVLLAKLLEQSGLPFYSAIGRFDFPQLAAVLAHSVGYLGNDTGLAHLAEAVGSRAVMIFGPTRPEMGFGPWNPQSKTVVTKLWCSPCGKDGRFCFRVTDRFACQRNILPKDVLAAVQEISRV